MIDWFASKFSMLIFAAGVLALLMFFVSFQTGAMSWDVKVRAAEDIARLIDATAQNSSVTYMMDMGSYSLVINKTIKSVIVDDKIKRHFIADVNETKIDSKAELKIENRGGTVYVS